MRKQVQFEWGGGGVAPVSLWTRLIVLYVASTRWNNYTAVTQFFYFLYSFIFSDHELFFSLLTDYLCFSFKRSESGWTLDATCCHCCFLLMFLACTEWKFHCQIIAWRCVTFDVSGNCGATFYISDSFLRHLEKEHSQLAIYSCHICGSKSFKPDRLIAVSACDHLVV